MLLFINARSPLIPSFSSVPPNPQGGKYLEENPFAFCVKKLVGSLLLITLATIILNPITVIQIKALLAKGS